MKPYYDHAGITIYHGDCQTLFPAVDCSVVMTDPPYGISLENHGMGAGVWTPVAGDDNPEAVHFVLTRAALLDLPVIIFASPWRPWSGNWRNLIAWDKTGAVGGGGDTARCLKRTWELIQVTRNLRWDGGRSESVWREPLTQNMLVHHPTQKPERLMHRLIFTFTTATDVICDPFMGSGTTLVAAKRIRRKAIGIEIDERYCEIAARRLSQEALPLELGA